MINENDPYSIKNVGFYIWVFNIDSSSINENISLAYEKDDIRLCTMQRAIPKQRIGVYFKYFKSERFHFIILDQDLPFSLASRAGIQNYDRVICFNGTNVENDTVDQFMHRFEIQRHLPVQMLVCSPSTYAHYKANNQVIRCDLPTVQRLKPVYATSSKLLYHLAIVYNLTFVQSTILL